MPKIKFPGKRHYQSCPDMMKTHLCLPYAFFDFIIRTIIDPHVPIVPKMAAFPSSQKQDPSTYCRRFETHLCGTSLHPRREAWNGHSEQQKGGTNVHTT